MSFGGSDPVITGITGGIYEEAEPYVSDILAESARLYASDVGRNYYPGSTVIPFAPETQAAYDLAEAQGLDMTGRSRLYDTAETTLGGFATGIMPDAYMNRGLGAGMGSAYTGRQAYGELTPQADYLSGVREGISSDVMQDIQSQFGGMGRTGTSPAAQQAAARGFTQAYAPIAQSAAEAERARELSSRESDIARMQSGGESALSRMYGSSQADIARQQQAREASLGRMFTGAQQLPGLQDTMDARRAAGIEGILGVGSAYEDLTARNLQDRINRFTFEQQSPYTRLANFISPITSIAALGNPEYQYAQQPNALTSAYGGAQAGYNIGSMFGMGPVGAVAGGLLGGFL